MIHFDLKSKFKKNYIKQVEKKIKEDLNKWKDIHVHGSEDFMLSRWDSLQSLPESQLTSLQKLPG